MSTSALHVAGRLAVLFVGALGCVKAQHPAPLTIASGCYALYADNWPAAAAAQTGLHSLPTYLALDTAAAGPRGRRVIVPTTWEPEDPNTRSAYWRIDVGSLVLNFLGPQGDFTASLVPARDDSYAGEGVGLGRGAELWPAQVHLSLVPTTCAGLVPGARSTAP